MSNHTITHHMHYNGDGHQEEKIDAAEAADARTVTEAIRHVTNNSKGGLNIGFIKRMVEKSQSDDFITAMSEWKYVGTRIATNRKEDCECGAKIKYINHAENTITKHKAQLGNDHLKCVLPDRLTSGIVKGNTIIVSNHARMISHNPPRRFPGATIDAMEESNIITIDEARILRRQPVDIRKLIAEGNADANTIVTINVRLANSLDLETQEINNVNFFENYNIDPALEIEEEKEEKGEEEEKEKEMMEYLVQWHIDRKKQAEEEKPSMEEQAAKEKERIAKGIIHYRNEIFFSKSILDRTFKRTIITCSTTLDFDKAMDEWKYNGTYGTSSTICEIVNTITGVVIKVEYRRLRLFKNILPFKRCITCPTGLVRSSKSRAECVWCAPRRWHY